MTNTAKPSLEVKFNPTFYGYFVYISVPLEASDEYYTSYLNAAKALDIHCKWGGYCSVGDVQYNTDTGTYFLTGEGHWRGWEFDSAEFELVKNWLHENFDLKVAE